VLRSFLQLTLFVLIPLTVPLFLHTMRETEKADSKRTQKTELADEQNRLSSEPPEVLFVGNSMVFSRIEREEFGRLSGRVDRFLTNAGSASACWYLYFKNIIVPSGIKPEMTFIFFRDEVLTWPEFRTGTFYQSYLDSLRREDEPVLDEVLFGAREARATLGFRVSNSVMSFYGIDLQPERLQSSLNDLSLDATALGSDKRPRRLYMNQRFGLERLRRDLAADDVQSLTERSGGEAPTKFDASLKASFLPHIIDIAQANGLPLCFYRVKKRVDVNGTREPAPYLPQYLSDLRAYLDSRGVAFIDESNDPIPDELYGDGDHILRRKRAEYTRLFWEKVKELLPPKI
jgi:hypothetical protein